MTTQRYFYSAPTSTNSLHHEIVYDDLETIELNLWEIDVSSLVKIQEYCNDVSKILNHHDQHEIDDNSNNHHRLNVTIVEARCCDDYQLSLTNNRKISCYSVFKLLSKQKRIHAMTFRNSTLPSSLFVQLLQHRESYVSLEKLHLHNCDIYDDSVNDVQNDTSHNSNIPLLYIQVRNAFLVNERLKSLILHNIDEDLMVIILHSLANNQHICHIYIKFLCLLNFKLMASMVNLLHNPLNVIQHLELWGFKFQGHLRFIMKQPIAHQNTVKMLKGIISCKTLNHITLESCSFDTASTIQFEDVISKSSVVTIKLEPDCFFDMKPKICVITSILKSNTCKLQNIKLNGIRKQNHFGLNNFNTIEINFLEFMNAIKEKEIKQPSSPITTLSLGYIGNYESDGVTNCREIIECLIKYIPQFTKLKSLSFQYDDENEHYFNHHDIIIQKFLLALQQNISLIQLDIDIPSLNRRHESMIDFYCQRNQLLSNILLNPKTIPHKLYPYLIQTIILQFNNINTNHGMNMTFQLLLYEKIK